MSDFFRVQLGIVSRSEGHSAAKRSAYQSCGPIVDHAGQRYDFSRKLAEHVQTIMLTPPDAPDWARQPESLWQRAAVAEKRVDAQEARIIDFSMPRAMPPELWEACIHHCYEPFLRMGMVLQVDIHDSLASDGGRNVNVHGLATLREFQGDGFSPRKNRAWNDYFRERNGRIVREQFAERLTAFCWDHGIDYKGDARANAERNLPDPEPSLPRWNFEAYGRGEVSEALAALQEHRRRRRQWEAARAEEIEASLELDRLEARICAQRQRRTTPVTAEQCSSSNGDRRAAILRAWHRNGWIDADTIPAVAAVRFDRKRNLLWIDLADGSTLVDRGDAITLRGRVTWQAAMETAAAAERHGWTSVEVSGDEGYKDAVAVACMLRGIEVANHTLSPKAEAVFDRLRTQLARPSGYPNRSQGITDSEETQRSSPLTHRMDGLSSQEIHRRTTKGRFVMSPPMDASTESDQPRPAYRPRFKSPAVSKQSLAVEH